MNNREAMLRVEAETGLKITATRQAVTCTPGHEPEIIILYVSGDNVIAEHNEVAKTITFTL